VLWRCLIGLLLAAPGCNVALAAVAFSDGEGGATCQYYAADGRLGWQHQGGDWMDAAGKEQGSTPFAQARVPVEKAPQQVQWQVTEIAEAWQRGDVPIGTLMLRALPQAGGSTVTFTSREGSFDRPVLVATWDDGRIDRLPAEADTYLACPTYRNLGREPVLKVSSSESTLLAFAWRPREGRQVRELSLQLTSAKQYGRGALIGVYGPRLPSVRSAARSGLSDVSPGDADLARHPDVLYSENFDRGDRWRILASDPATQDSLTVVDRDPSEDFEPLSGRALRVTLHKGKRQALNHQLRFAELLGGEPEEAYFRYHLRLAAHWDPVIEGGKLPGFAGTYGQAGWGQRRVDGHNGWSARGAFFQLRAPASTIERAIGTYAYTASADSALGDVWGWNLGPTGRLQKNRWYAIEQYVKLNTPGKADGILRAWVNGQLALSKEDIRFRDVPSLKVESVWLNVYHGGIHDADRDLTLYIDNLVVARRYIGPGRFPR
jgi:hypothetical protein